MSDLLQFRPLTVEDLTEMMEIERLAFDKPWSASMVRDCLQAAHCQVWGVCEGKRLIGFGILSVILDEAELLAMSVDPNFQGQGFGTQLLNFLIGRAVKAHAENLFLEVRVSNDAAVAVYTKAGFEMQGKRKDYYPHTRHGREDACLMSLDLSKRA